MARRALVDDEAAERAQALAALQSGVLSRKDALDCGYTPAQLVTLVRRGDWTKLAGGCLAPVRGPADPALAALEVAAAVRLRGAPASPAGARFVGTGAVAARVLGLPLLEPDSSVRLIDRTPPRGRSTALRAALRASDVVTRRGVCVTSPARTASDLARWHGLLAGVVAADAALRQGVPAAELGAAAAHVVRLSNGRTALRVADLARPTAESPLESIGRVQLVLHGIPEPDGQREVEDASGSFIGRVDHVWPALRVIGEADGRTKYDEEGNGALKRGVLWEEKKREDRLRVGFEVFRYTWAEAYHHPEQLVAKATEALDRACSRFRLPPWRGM